MDTKANFLAAIAGPEMDFSMCLVNEEVTTEEVMLEILRQGNHQLFDQLFREDAFKPGPTGRSYEMWLTWAWTKCQQFFSRPVFRSGVPTGKRQHTATGTSKLIIVAPMYAHEYCFVGEAAVLLELAKEKFDEIHIFVANADDRCKRQFGFNMYRAQLNGALDVLSGQTKIAVAAYVNCIDAFCVHQWKDNEKIKFHQLCDCPVFMQGLANDYNCTTVMFALIDHGTQDVFVCGPDDCQISSMDTVQIVASLLAKGVTVLSFFTFCQANCFFKALMADERIRESADFGVICAGGNTDWNVVLSDCPDLIVGGATLGAILGLRHKFPVWKDFIVGLQDYGNYLPHALHGTKLLYYNLKIWGMVLENGYQHLPNYFVGEFQLDIQKAGTNIAPGDLSANALQLLHELGESLGSDTWRRRATLQPPRETTVHVSKMLLKSKVVTAKNPAFGLALFIVQQ
eukprot:TRINITY_DN3265_c0_g1_i1.p1 TRINITY_DN3265_c0_g1~~TRINITY_DN3265_c0_g1_i1.p1  ORF type:complete len:456 (+),score=73.79 TRINITY_DN3265_c0_g1_i1:96-1463(+)